MWNLDYNAGAPLDPRVQAEMLELPEEADGNPSSPHRLGRRARGILEDARERVAGALGVRPVEIVFSSGGTESNNLAVHSGFAHAARRGGEVWLSPIEHPSVTESCRYLAETSQAGSRMLAAGRDGRVVIPTDSLPSFISLIHAHHETGVVQDLAQLSTRLRESGGLLHSDASQSLGRLDLGPVVELCDLLTLSPHKAGGPRGIGVLVVREGREFRSVLRGGSQELGRRPGTQCPRLAAGAARAIELACSEWRARAELMQSALDAFLSRLPLSGKHSGTCRVVCTASPPGSMLPNTRSLSFHPLEARLLLPALDMQGILVSYGAACSSGAMDPSPSLLALGLAEEEARSCLRISVGPERNSKKIDQAADLFLQVIARIGGEFS
ncbi:MAG: cysteine desulfurase family protein [Planctomycetota bacterium]